MMREKMAEVAQIGMSWFIVWTNAFLSFFCFSLLTSHVLRMKTEFQTIQLRHNIGWLPSGGGGADKSLQILTNR